MPDWIGRLFARAPLAFGLPLSVLVAYEALRWFSDWASAWPSLGALAAVVFFIIVPIELFADLSRPGARGFDRQAQASEGAPAFASGTARSASQGAARIAARCVVDPLTPREREVLELLLEGWRNADIAARHGLSPNTVRNHVYGIYQKTGAANRIELAAMAQE